MPHAKFAECCKKAQMFMRGHFCQDLFYGLQLAVTPYPGPKAEAQSPSYGSQKRLRA